MGSRGWTWLLALDLVAVTACMTAPVSLAVPDADADGAQDTAEVSAQDGTGDDESRVQDDSETPIDVVPDGPESDAEVVAGDALLDAEVDCNAWCGPAECGDDGCGGTCGTCQDGKVCEAGICVCLPEAEKRCCGQAVCWFDSCGVQGPKVTDCPSGCSEALCIDCLSQCEGKSCGPDGCGGNCGRCLPGSCDGLVWTVAPACVDGTCTSGDGTQDCDDGNACTRDTCDAARGCGNWTEKDGAKCVEGTCVSLLWTKPRTCLAGQCTEGGGTTLDCDDRNPCTEDSCSTDAGCLNVANTKSCNDNDPCTLTDICSGGTCVGTGALACDDHNPCTTDFCQTGLGCKTTNLEDGTGCGAKACNGLTFTPESTCQAGVCTIGGGGAQSCDDEKTCTVDSCDATTGCKHDLVTGNCLIDETCYGDAQSGTDVCKECKVDTSTSQWTNAANGKSCGDAAHVCFGGSCCTRQCGGKVCGDDGCGGTCGTCPADTTCQSGQCVASATVCNGVTCPVVSGYDVTCNARQHCEYANVDTSGWKQWDVWVHVPAGTFTMGSPPGEGFSDEKPQHTVTFAKGYLIGKYEVVVQQYEACQSASPGTCTEPSTADWDGCSGLGVNTSANGRGTHPQNGLMWDQLGAVCTWLGGRRPSEAEWEYAATGPTHRKYPWGDM